MGYRDYPSRIPTDPKEKEIFMRRLGLEHLLRAWQWFEVYHLNPYVPPYFSLPKEQYKKKQEDGDEGGEGGGDGVRIIEIKKVFKIYDFGDYLATSAGEDYGLLATGRLLMTIDKIMDILEKRGATEIAFGKDCLQAGKLYAWQKAVTKNMKVFDFQPTQEDLARLGHTYGELERALQDEIRPD